MNRLSRQTFSTEEKGKNTVAYDSQLGTSAEADINVELAMQWKYQREAHNRQDKVDKPDYWEDFIAESQFKASPLYIECFRKLLTSGKRRMETEKELRPYRDQLILRYFEGVFRLGGRDFQFRWSLKKYVEHNRLEDHFSRTHKQHKKAAIQDFKAIESAIYAAPASVSEGRQHLQIVFDVALHCDSIMPFRLPEDDIEFRPLFKRVV